MSHGVNGPDDGSGIVMAEIGEAIGSPARYGCQVHIDQRVKVGADGVAISFDPAGRGIDGPEGGQAGVVRADIIEQIGAIIVHVSSRKGQACVAGAGNGPEIGRGRGALGYDFPESGSAAVAMPEVIEVNLSITDIRSRQSQRIVIGLWEVESRRDHASGGDGVKCISSACGMLGGVKQRGSPVLILVRKHQPMQVSDDVETIGKDPTDGVNGPKRGCHGIRRDCDRVVRGNDGNKVGGDDDAAVGHNGQFGRRVGTADGEVAARERRTGPGGERDRAKHQEVARLAAEHEDVRQGDVAGVAHRSSEYHGTTISHRAWRTILRDGDDRRGHQLAGRRGGVGNCDAGAGVIARGGQCVGDGTDVQRDEVAASEVGSHSGSEDDRSEHRCIGSRLAVHHEYVGQRDVASIGDGAREHQGSSWRDWHWRAEFGHCDCGRGDDRTSRAGRVRDRHAAEARGVNCRGARRGGAGRGDVTAGKVRGLTRRQRGGREERGVSALAIDHQDIVQGDVARIADASAVSQQLPGNRRISRTILGDSEERRRGDRTGRARRIGDGDAADALAGGG